MNIKALWNSQADHQNQWDSLGEDEKLEFAMAHEREECADFAERRVLATENNDQKIGYYHACRTIAAGIRARGKA
jgi:hypothetical protein